MTTLATAGPDGTFSESFTDTEWGQDISVTIDGPGSNVWLAIGFEHNPELTQLTPAEAAQLADMLRTAADLAAIKDGGA